MLKVLSRAFVEQLRVNTWAQFSNYRLGNRPSEAIVSSPSEIDPTHSIFDELFGLDLFSKSRAKMWFEKLREGFWQRQPK